MTDVNLSLSAQRVLFTSLLAKLLLHAETLGLRVAIDQVKRTQLEANANAASGAGISNSLHLQGLAADLLIYGNTGEYITGGAPYNTLGAYWKSLHPLNRWGGDFKKVDSGHFSSTRGGVQ